MEEKTITLSSSIEAPSSSKMSASFGKRLLAHLRSGQILGLLSVLVVWQLAAIISPEDTLAPPYAVFRAAIFHVILEDNFFKHIGSTVLRIICGFGIAFVIGHIMGVMMGVGRYWERFFSDYVTVGITIPTLAWAVIGVLWLGIHYLTPVFSAVMIATPYVTVNVWQGMKSVDKELVDMGLAFEVSRGKIILNVYIASILPFTFAATRIGFSVSWKLVVLAEVFGSSEGIGYMIYYWFENFDMTLVLAWVLVFCLIMYIYEYGIVKNLEKRLFAWRREVVLI
jgi:ABC-type nitrate/sulfonate/bicarbonate transport system permease component